MLLLLLSLLTFLAEPSSTEAKLTVEVTNVTKVSGKIRVALYRPTEKFGSAKPDFYKIIPIGQSGPQQVSFEVEPGRYAVAVYHDQNGNDKLDKNVVGYPREPFGFSNNFRPVLSAPKFEDCAFILSRQGSTISIKLID